ncbi:MAG: hypothetical protein KF900_13790 [Bacteroidetes bacterium]|nr:hypothetical protein [Bacteroidota bacterium]
MFATKIKYNLAVCRRITNPAERGYTRTYTYNAHNNRLTQTTVGSNTYNYSYHAQHGFITEMPHLPVMQWNFKEELAATSKQSVSAPNIPETTYYQYDSKGKRLRKITENFSTGTTPTKKDQRIYIEGYEWYEDFGSSDTTETLSLIDEGRRFVMIENSSVSGMLTRYIHPNHQSSCTLETDDNGDIITYEEYHPFGTTSYQATNASITAAAKRYRYTGMERDDETGLNYHNARYYINWLGRWLNCDPIGINDGVNVYVYCHNNPTMNTDVRGTQTKPNQVPNLQAVNTYGATSQGTTAVSNYAPNDIKNVSKEQKDVAKSNRSETSVSDNALGKLSEKHETGGRGADTVSSGKIGKGKKDDPGGVSYGSYQMTSRTTSKDGTVKIGGRVGEFVKSPEAKAFADKFVGLTPGTAEFTTAWKDVAKSSPDQFKQAQHDFIKRTHYDVNKAQISEKLGLNIDGRSSTLKDVVWSTAVQHGPNNKVFQNALKGKDVSKMSDEEIIKAVYQERGSKSGTGTGLKYFKWANTDDSQKPLTDRFNAEQKEALQMLNQKTKILN